MYQWVRVSWFKLSEPKIEGRPKITLVAVVKRSCQLRVDREYDFR